MPPPVPTPKLTPGRLLLYRIVFYGRAATRYYGLHRLAWTRRDQFRLVGQAAKYGFKAAWEPVNFTIVLVLASMAIMSALALENWPGAIIYFEEAEPDPDSETILTVRVKKGQA